MRAFRDAVAKELKECFDVRAIAQAPPTYDCVVAWWRLATEDANTGDCSG